MTAPTGVALIAVDEAGENQIAVASGANNELTPEAVEAALAGAEPGGVVLIGLEVPDAPVLAAARAARAADLQVVLNPAPARPLPDELLALGPVLTPNEPEAAALSGEADPEAAARALTHAHRRAGGRDDRAGGRAARRRRRARADPARQRSRRSTPPARATRSTARSPPRWRAAPGSPTPCGPRSPPPPTPLPGPARGGRPCA